VAIFLLVVTYRGFADAMTYGHNSLTERNGSVIWNLSALPGWKLKPRIADDTRIYAIGDVHGRADLLAEMFAAIDASLVSHPIDNPIQILLGDYIDRGPRSREVIDALLLREQQHTMIYLRGNHESYAVQFLNDPSVLSEWLHVGGANTLLSYGLRPSVRNDAQQQQDLSIAFAKALPRSHRDFMENLTLSYSCGDFFFAHAGVRPGVPLAEQSEHDLIWIREDFLLHEEDFGKIIVHGHSPTKEPQVRPNRINIDTGAYATGRLTCLVLQGDQMVVI
jgi:serine/threonine protein phosphatase 1